MTLIRRTAQLINDLRVLNTIRESDKIECTFIGGVICLKVDFFEDWTYSETSKKSVKAAIETEFEDLYIKEAYIKDKSIKFYICKDEITDNKLDKI